MLDSDYHIKIFCSLIYFHCSVYGIKLVQFLWFSSVWNSEGQDSSIFISLVYGWSPPHLSPAHLYSMSDPEMRWMVEQAGGNMLINSDMTSLAPGTCGLNSLVPGICDSKFKIVISELMLCIKFMSSSCEIPLRWMPQNTPDDESKLFLFW